MILRRLGPQDSRHFQDIINVPVQNDVPFALFYQPGMSFPDYLKLLNAREKGFQLSEDGVPTTILFAFDNDKIVGRLSLRHFLNDRGLNVDGHMGFVVHPNFLRKGFASEMIFLAFPFARQLAISRLLLTADDNTASQRFLEKLGAIYENTYSGPHAKKPVKRYWLDVF